MPEAGDASSAHDPGRFLTGPSPGQSSGHGSFTAGTRAWKSSLRCRSNTRSAAGCGRKMAG